MSYIFSKHRQAFLLIHPLPKPLNQHQIQSMRQRKQELINTVKQSVMDTDFNVDMESMHLNCQAEKMIEEYGIPYTYNFPHPNEFM